MPSVRPLACVAIVLGLTLPPTGLVNAQTPTPPPLDFSGVLYANFQRRTDSSSKAMNGGKPGNKFDIERVYLTFRVPVGDRASARLTTDVFNGDQSSASYYKGWSIRLKYAYLQLNFANDIAGVKGLNGSARIGMLQNVMIDHEEAYWPRYLSSVAEERTGGFFASSDLGAALLVTLPNRMGEIYSSVVNGPGYTAAEADRFKDVSLRATFTPLANSDAFGGFAKTFAISPWVYIGQTASKFQNGGEGQAGPVPDGLTRNRYGVFVGNRDRRVTFGVGYGERQETAELGANTAASPRTTRDVTGELIAGFAVVRPGAFGSADGQGGRWGLVGRVDRFKPNTEGDAANQFTVLGAFWDVTPRVTLALDAQQLGRKNGSTVTETKTMFLHVQASY